jgi:anti-anti-sigma factor
MSSAEDAGMSKYRHIVVDREADAFCVSLRSRKLEELEIHEMADEVHALISGEGCRKLVLSLGPGTPEFLYSVFLAKLVGIRRRLREQKGQMRVVDVTPEVMTVFEACQLDKYFEFVPDRQTGIASFQVG